MGVVCVLVGCKLTRRQVSINVVVSGGDVVWVSFENYLMWLVVELLHPLRQVPGGQVEGGSLDRGPVWVSRWLVVCRLRILNLLKDLLSHHLINESLLFLSIFCCLSYFPDLYLSLIIVDNLNDIIIPHLSRIISW
jgi:hypothetical protein